MFDAFQEIFRLFRPTPTRPAVVAFLDTGVDLDALEEAGALWTNPGEIPGDGIDNAGNGYIDDVHGYDFFNEDNQPRDDNGLGSVGATAALDALAAFGPGIFQVMPLKMLGSEGTGYLSGALQAWDYAVFQGATASVHVYGTVWNFEELEDAAAYAQSNGHLVLTFAGTNPYGTGADLSIPNPNADNDFYPCEYNGLYELTLCVTAADENGVDIMHNYGPVDLGVDGMIGEEHGRRSLSARDLTGTVYGRVERFDRRPIEPFELFTSEFGQNSVRIQENSSKIFRKFRKFEKLSTFSKAFSEIPRNFRQNRCKIR
jgi:hypothetical protein